MKFLDILTDIGSVNHSISVLQADKILQTISFYKKKIAAGAATIKKDMAVSNRLMAY